MSIILVDTKGLCFCNCATKCVLGHIGGASRCSKKELESQGYKVIQVANKKSEKAISDAMCCDGKNHKIKIKNIKTDDI